MRNMRAKLGIAALIITAAVSFLTFAALRSQAWTYSLDIGPFLDDVSYHTKRVRLEGRVGDENVIAERGLLHARFDLESESRSVPVEYNGQIPDMFKAGRDVIVEGRLDEDGVFQADVLLTKCASKYQEAEGEVCPTEAAEEEAGVAGTPGGEG